MRFIAVPNFSGFSSQSKKKATVRSTAPAWLAFFPVAMDGGKSRKRPSQKREENGPRFNVTSIHTPPPQIALTKQNTERTWVTLLYMYSIR